MVHWERILSFSKQIARDFQPERIILFGSYAYGSPRDDSDVDILVILPFEGRSARKILEILNKTNPQIPVDLIVCTPERLRERINKNDWFMQEITEKGRLLYAADHAGVGK
jgi:predicted nucleotidyltransferase